MSASSERRAHATFAGTAVFMVLCCAVGPAVIGSVAGSAVGGWLGIACAAVLATIAALLLHRRKRGRSGC